ncbi:hypothetical protein FNV43_RR20302 [Rhamnella rubrinervis]|uniref:Uncharacterized protein n=1 Tax=Rhamnella rubrinervis TaxID=2594499 RepID=A0A8K0GUG3_9ROSA|nr:hypothetical protein FNV43_RR20302 [Rhamnella rubrinervis]
METSIDKSSKVLQEQKIVVLADLNVDPETDGNDSSSVQLPAPDLTRLVIDESSQDKSTSMSIDNDVVEGEAKRVNKLGKCRSRNSKALVHVTRKMPKNAHAHFVLGLMYQRLGQPSKCLLLESSGDNNVDEELEPEELKEILSKLKESIQLDIRQAASAISVLSSLLAVAPTTMIALETLGLLTFKELVLKDQNHPAALINYAHFFCVNMDQLCGANAGDGASKDQAAKLEPNCMSTRYAVAIQSNQGCKGVAMVHKAQHEIAAAFETEHNVLQEVKSCCLQFKAAEDPDDAVQWHQLGLHSLCTRQFKTHRSISKLQLPVLKSAAMHGISLQLCEEPAQAEEVYKRALSLATKEHSLELQPGYAPAFNNLGLVFVAEGQWEEAKFCFEKALKADPLLDAAKSNMIKTMAISRLYSGLS